MFEGGNNRSVPRVATFDLYDPSEELPETTMHYRKLGKTQTDVALKLGAATSLRPGLTRNTSVAASLGGMSYRSGVSYRSAVSYRSGMGQDIATKPPSSSKDKSKMTRRYCATVFAIMYAVFLVIFGGVAFILDAALEDGLYPIGEVRPIYIKHVDTI